MAESTFDGLPKEKLYIFQSQPPLTLEEDQAQAADGGEGYKRCVCLAGADEAPSPRMAASSIIR